MKNPTRRNRNIGTSKQGIGQNNEFSIPSPASTSKTFYERLGRYRKCFREINGTVFEFVIEETRLNSEHACTVDDLVELIKYVPSRDYQGLNLLILRQPKRKEEMLAPVWGRLIYKYEFEKTLRPAIILEAVDYRRQFKWSKSLLPDDSKELERLRSEGHQIVEDKRYFIADYELNNVRNTQLYRTLLHEFGRYVQYLQEVEQANSGEEDLEAWESRFDNYQKVSKAEKEKFAHSYAEKLFLTLKAKNVIPFNRIES